MCNCIGYPFVFSTWVNNLSLNPRLNHKLPLLCFKRLAANLKHGWYLMCMYRNTHIYLWLKWEKSYSCVCHRRGKFYPNLYLLNFFTVRCKECMKVFFLDLPMFVMDNLINLCDIKVVHHIPPLVTVPSLFCKGTVGWKKTFCLAF